MSTSNLVERPKLYLETTIPSYLASRASRDLIVAARQKLTQDWWDERRVGFELFVSESVIQEITGGDPKLAAKRLGLLESIPILPINPEVRRLAQSLLEDGPIPSRAIADAAHIAIATVYGCEFLLTWNCRHIANAELFRAIRRIVEAQGYDVPSMCTPEELMGGEL
jgi:predicted nucleic acid-binding protein